MNCAVCGVEITAAIVTAGDVVSTDAGPVHRECFEGPVPPGSEFELDALEEAAEEERRRDMGDVPLDPRATSKCPECGDPSNGGRCFECRGKSMI